MLTKCCQKVMRWSNADFPLEPASIGWMTLSEHCYLAASRYVIPRGSGCVHIPMVAIMNNS